MKPEQREYIIELASKMFVKDGVKAVTMSEIAALASVSKRTIYEEFTDKEELLYLAATHYLNARMEVDKSLMVNSPNLLVGILSVMEDIANNSELTWKLHRNIKNAYPTVDRRLHESQAPNTKRFLEMLAQGVNEGLISPRSNLELSILMLHHTASNLVHEDRELSLPKDVTPQEAFIELAINFMRGIATPRGVEIIDEYIENRRDK